jgi:opacity protein-like surface antigen
MKRYSILVIVVASLLFCSIAQGAPPIFKEKKLFGPIPYNSFSMAVGFLDGADFTFLTEHLSDWAKAHHGSDTFEELSPAPYGRLSYERQITPNHFLKGSASMSYINTSSVGSYVASVNDTTNVALTSSRTLKVYLLTLEAGFSYCFIPPEPQRFSPYFGAGFAGVIPMVRLDTESTTLDGSPFANPTENVSQNSFQAGLHMEFGMTYYITNRYAAGLEGKYQMSQSKFDIHNGNFDLKYSGFILSLNLIYYL